MIKNAVDELELAVFPNPFSSKTFIEFTVPETEKATLEVYTVTGVKLATLFEATAEANIKYTVEFSGSSHLRQEIYVYVLRTSTQVKHGRIIMIR